METVSVHIVTFNSEIYIHSCLESIFQQTYPIRNVIVVDNHSTDRTREILANYQDRIEIILNSSNKGFAPAHNQAIQCSSCDYYLVLNPDIRLDQDYVSHLVEALNTQPEAGSSTGKLLSQNELGKLDSTGLTINRARRAFDRGQNEPANQWSKPSEVFGVSGAAGLYSKKMVEDISIDGEFFDEDFFAYKEDVDVSWRAQLMGWKAYYEPKALASHERGWKSGKRMDQPLFVRRLSYINRYKMILKNDRFGYVCLHLFPLLFFEALSFGYTLLKEPGLLPIWGDFFKKLPHLLNKRKQIQAKRRVRLEQVYQWFVKT
ncbi:MULTISPECIES: glycosyltransferase family 2 protein [unclassified Paenibacillus]|uniref:glycosyltransferase family 2 protein n=1 Tax=unclassified Paenibacillus TaxID=185978 RepID=UPI001AE6C001|nr:MULTISPECIES: glycosyltransferase family 2 protein [unclassified Paenibacillus]MBP1157458.1 GT2 family glycosyltransferase [Paenibacillus sp. PvP091]MBP1171805.1 GT2 family glycosyltransferase [Paenibacillus sp. PvR098]MBP2438186.1 GT2 family glycosyltransferase [Paenibacillus sp. PvP052]